MSAANFTYTSSFSSSSSSSSSLSSIKSKSYNVERNGLSLTSAISDALSTPLNSVRELPETEMIKKGTPEAFVLILQHEVQKLGILKSFAEELQSGQAKPATTIEMKSMILEQIPALVSGKIEVDFNSIESISSFIGEITTRMTHIYGLLSKPDVIPNELLVKYKNEIKRRDQEIAFLEGEIATAMTALQKHEFAEERPAKIDQLIGELLVKKELLRVVTHVHLEENLDIVKYAKSKYGCTLTPLQLLSRDPGNLATSTVDATGRVATDALTHLQSTISIDAIHPSIDTIFMRQACIGTNRSIDTTQINQQYETAVPNDALYQRMIEEEKRVIETLTHYKLFSSELESRGNDAVTQVLRVRFEDRILKKIQIPLLPQNTKELLERIQRDLKLQKLNNDTYNHKWFSIYVTNRTLEAKNNLKALQAGTGQTLPIVARYRAHILSTFLPIANLHNLIITKEADDYFDEDTVLQKGFCMRVIAQEIDRSQFLIY